MLTTITVNPCVDRFILVDELKVGEIHRPMDMLDFPAGKGIDVSRVAAVLGEKTMALGIVGGHTGTYMQQALHQQGVPTDFVHSETETRICTKIVDVRNYEHTEFNVKGLPVSQEIMTAMNQKVEEWIPKSEILSMSGSLLPNMPIDLYRQYIESAKKKGVITFLDGTGPVFLEALEAGPYFVKPNIHELEDTFKVKTSSLKEVEELAKKMLDKGVEVCTVSMGGDGSLVVTREQTFKVYPMRVQLKSVVGAGDSFVSGFGVGLIRGMKIEDCIKLGTACATSTIQNIGTTLSKLEQVNELVPQIKVELL